jgi:hypothetical protein
MTQRSDIARASHLHCTYDVCALRQSRPVQQHRKFQPKRRTSMDLYDITDEEITEARAIILAETADDGYSDPDFDL